MYIAAQNTPILTLMKSNKLTDLTIEELNKQKKLLTGVLAGFSIVMVVAYSILIYLMFASKDFKLFTIVPLGFVGLLPAIIRLDQINTELKSRSANNG